MDGGVKARRYRRSQKGYMLALLLAFVTAMGILLLKAMPSVIAEVQRDQEEELIFRGEALQRAIALYRARTGQYPISLENLIKARPRLLRKLYKDPMTREGDWGLITAVQPGASGDLTNLPIVGVRSRCQKDSFKSYKGKTLVSDWTFSAAEGLLGVPGSSPKLGPGVEGDSKPGADPEAPSPGKR